MLTYAKLLLALINIGRAIFRWLEKEKWMDAGKAQLLQEQMKDMENEIRLMRAAADAVVFDDRVHMEDDPDNRANWPADRDGK